MSDNNDVYCLEIHSDGVSLDNDIPPKDDIPPTPKSDESKPSKFISDSWYYNR